MTATRDLTGRNEANQPSSNLRWRNDVRERAPCGTMPLARLAPLVLPRNISDARHPTSYGAKYDQDRSDGCGSRVGWSVRWVRALPCGQGSLPTDEIGRDRSVCR